MELRHLRYFLAVAEELHFHRAATRLHISQPPLSQQIRALERELGVTLLERNRRRVALTAAGEVFRDDARAILAAVERASERAQNIARGSLGTLSIGFVGSAMFSETLPDILREFRSSRPDVALVLRLAEAVLQGADDLAREAYSESLAIFRELGDQCGDRHYARHHVEHCSSGVGEVEFVKVRDCSDVPALGLRVLRRLGGSRLGRHAQAHQRCGEV